MIGYALLGDLLDGEFAALDLGGHSTERIHDLRAPSVIQREIQDQPRIPCGALDGMPQRLPADSREFVGPSHRHQPHVVLHQLLQFLAGRIPKKPHQSQYLAPRAIPILYGEGIERQYLDAQLTARLHHVPHGRPACAMSLAPIQSLPLCPSPVSVHDDGDVPRQTSSCSKPLLNGPIRFPIQSDASLFR